MRDAEVMEDAIARNLTLAEEARHFANLYAYTAQLQIKRMSQGPSDEFPLSWFVDFEFLLVSLRKLRRSAQLLHRIPSCQSDMEIALNAFDAALPWLADLRNASEHFDEHLEGKDRGKNLVSSYPSQFSTLLGIDGGVEWLGKPVKFNACLDAAHGLFDAVRTAHRRLAGLAP